MHGTPSLGSLIPTLHLACSYSRDTALKAQRTS